MGQSMFKVNFQALYRVTQIFGNVKTRAIFLIVFFGQPSIIYFLRILREIISLFLPAAPI